MSTITTKDNCKLYVKDWGSGRPVIMMHGWPLSADSFDDLSMALADAGRAAAKGIANSTLIEYDGSPHGLFASDKQRLIADVLAFVQRG